MDEFSAKYPFSEHAKSKLADVFAVSDEELSLAYGRAISDLKNEPRKPIISDHKKEVISYILARILVASSKIPSAAVKFANFEANSAVAHLKNEEAETFDQLCLEFIGSYERKSAGVSLSVIDYLKYGGDFVNENAAEGRVFFSKNEFLGVLRRAIELRILDIAFDPKSLPPNIRLACEKLKEQIEKESLAANKSTGSFKGKYLGLPAMQKILLGLSEGKRYYGSMSLAIACLKDGLPREDAEQVMITYARNCSRSTHAYTEREALASLEWVYKHPTINFSLKTLKEQALVDDATFQESEQQFRKQLSKLK